MHSEYALEYYLATYIILLLKVIPTDVTGCAFMLWMILAAVLASIRTKWSCTHAHYCKCKASKMRTLACLFLAAVIGYCGTQGQGIACVHVIRVYGYPGESCSKLTVKSLSPVQLVTRLI